MNVADTTGYPTTVNEGTTIKAFAESLTAPTKAADEDYTYAFAGWYTDADLTVPATAETDVADLAVEGVITLYAKYDATAIPQDKTYKITGYVDDAYATVTVGETTVNVASNGAFEIAGLENGTYSVVVKAPGALNRTLSATISDADVALSTDTDKITLMYGATSSDAESIGLADLLLIKTNYNVASGEDEYDISLDFDRDGTIGLADLLLVKTNYNKTIDEAYGE